MNQGDLRGAYGHSQRDSRAGNRPLQGSALLNARTESLLDKTSFAERLVPSTGALFHFHREPRGGGDILLQVEDVE